MGELSSLKGKVALVTGSTRGIGRAIADSFLLNGCEVIYTGRSRELDLPNYQQLDLGCDESIINFLKRIKKFESIDILINNAGINIIEPINELGNDNWNKIIKVNLTGPMLLTREVSKMMIAQNSGKIVNISSIYGKISRAQRSSYSSAKTGLIGLTRASALDLAKYNILVNAMCVGFTSTELTKSILSSDEIEKLKREIPLGKLARVDEIAKLAYFLCSDDNSYITGQTITIDGGVTIK